jgi:hypothetical protein
MYTRKYARILINKKYRTIDKAQEKCNDKLLF